ncbi:hypothetical protein Q5P01_003942 [Channa striata]|uniref:Rad21/Rec8-like protein N-terminal domain-containing protein n=1 Tax=Channa striata TaxID=64152 RepID=A0AA88T9U8_CHASR|nr:hypothetical protein Q5P01_003942 [Channa striata]
MFNYPVVLHCHTGRFSTTWLAATRGIRPTRKELLKVDLGFPAPQPKLPRPRFSLCLSSQLQYGVVIVYHKQCGFMLEEVQQIIDWLLLAKACIHIDMAEIGRSDTNTHIRLVTHIQTFSVAPSFPYRHGLDVPESFYMMELAHFWSHEINSPAEFMIEEVGSQHSLVLSPHFTLDNNAAITLTEKEQLVISTAEVHHRIDLLMDQPDQFHREVEEMQTYQRIRECQGAMSCQSVEVLQAAVALEMTPLQVNMPSPPSEASEKDQMTESTDKEVVVPPARKPVGGQRRQLVFADPGMQISDRTIKKQIRNPLMKVLLHLPTLTKRVPPRQLFSAPCGCGHVDLQSLWKQYALITVLPECGEKQREEKEEEGEEVKGESEQDKEILRTERSRRHSGMKEVAALDVILDMSNEDKSVNDVITPVSKCWIPSSLQRLGEVTFDSLLPQEFDRTTAPHTFYKLLELLSINQVTACQTEPCSLTPRTNPSPSGHDTGRPGHPRVKERVVWVDTKKTQVKNKAGKLKEKEITILEVRVKAQRPGDKQLQEVLYSTEAHTDRSFCRTGMNILPWKQRCTGDNGLAPAEITMALDTESRQLD